MIENNALLWLENNDLSYNIWNKYRNNKESLDEWFDRVSGGDENVKSLIRLKKFLFGGRTLSNRNTDKGSYNNCYSIGFVPDSLEGIFDINTKIGMTFKAQGGQGLSLSKIRPKGSPIKGGIYQSDGIVPFMEMYNTTTASISQGGSRKGALLMSLSVWHPEIMSFISIKAQEQKINKANLSVEIDNSFMRLVESYFQGDIDENFCLEKPWTNGTISSIQKYYPIKIYKEICKYAKKHAEPGIIFTDRFRNYNIMEFVDDYQIETCNPCGICLPHVKN